MTPWITFHRLHLFPSVEKKTFMIEAYFLNQTVLIFRQKQLSLIDFPILSLITNVWLTVTSKVYWELLSFIKTIQKQKLTLFWCGLAIKLPEGQWLKSVDFSFKEFVMPSLKSVIAI